MKVNTTPLCLDSLEDLECLAWLPSVYCVVRPLPLLSLMECEVLFLAWRALWYSDYVSQLSRPSATIGNSSGNEIDPRVAEALEIRRKALEEESRLVF